MPKMLVLRGLPGSGKTTFRHQYLTANPAARYVNKDELRAQFGERESAIHVRQMQLLRQYLGAGHDVVVDNTSLNPRAVSECHALAQGFGATFEVVDFATPWQECVARDETRRQQGERATGRNVIIQMAMRYGLYNAPMRPAIVFDVDYIFPALADIIGKPRQPLQEPLNCDENLSSSLDEVFISSAIRQFYTSAQRDVAIIFLSGRSEKHRPAIEAWLQANGFDTYFALFMRAQGDNRTEPEVKRDLYRRYLRPYFLIETIIDELYSAGSSFAML